MVGIDVDSPPLLVAFVFVGATIQAILQVLIALGRFEPDGFPFIVPESRAGRAVVATAYVGFALVCLALLIASVT